MVIDYALWSSIISLAAILFLYSTKAIAKGNWLSQFYASLLLFPALISSFYLTELVYKNQIIINKVTAIPMTKLFFGIYFNDLNSIILSSLNLAFIMIVFLLPRKKIDENISLLSLSFLLLLTITLMPDHLIRMLSFSFGSIAITHTLINSEDNEDEINYLTKLCALNLISDFLIFISLLSLFIDQNTVLVYKHGTLATLPRYLCFFAIVLRLLSLIAVLKPTNMPINTTIKKSIFILVTGAGSQIMLLQFSHILFLHDKIDKFFIFCAVVMVFFCLFILIYDRKKINWSWHFLTLFIACTLLIICLGYNFIAAVMMCLTLFIFPLIILPSIIKSVITLHGDSARNISPANPFTTILDILFFRLPKKIIYFFSKLFINFLYPLYAGFLLYRMPQILVGMIQTPLRFLNNGNIERSLIFVLFLLTSYIYWWGGGRE